MRPALLDLLDRRGLHSLAWLVPNSGFVYLLIFLVCGAVFWRRARESGLPFSRAVDLWLIGTAGAVIGARIYYLVITNGFFQLPVRSWFSISGTGSWGAYLGATAGLTLFCVLRRTSPWPWVDIAASVAPLTEVIGRWSCWLAGDDFGKVSSVPWAIQFPQGSLPWKAHLSRGLLRPTAEWSLPVHPEQFYLMGTALLSFVAISVVWRKARGHPGTTFAAYLLLFGIARFGWEFLRDDPAGGFPGGLSSSQWMCIGYAIAGMTLLTALRRSITSARTL